MNQIEIKVLGPSGHRTTITVERPSELETLSQAIGLLLASYGSQIREAVAAVRTVADVVAAEETQGERPHV